MYKKFRNPTLEYKLRTQMRICVRSRSMCELIRIQRIQSRLGPKLPFQSCVGDIDLPYVSININFTHTSIYNIFCSPSSSSCRLCSASSAAGCSNNAVNGMCRYPFPPKSNPTIGCASLQIGGGASANIPGGGPP